MKFHFSRGRFHRYFIAVSTVGLVFAAIFVPLPVPAYVPQSHTLHITARTFAFEPGSISIHRGDTVTLDLEALDAVHGLYVDGYAVNLVAEPGKSATTTFVADREGKFKFRCSVTCGALHPFMIGELNVEPDIPLVRALVITLMGVIGALAFFWK